MIPFNNKKLAFLLQVFCIFVFFCICVFLYLDWPSPHSLPITPSQPIISSATKVTDCHTAPSVCVTTDQLQGTAAVRAQ